MGLISYFPAGAASPEEKTSCILYLGTGTANSSVVEISWSVYADQSLTARVLSESGDDITSNFTWGTDVEITLISGTDVFNIEQLKSVNLFSSDEQYISGQHTGTGYYLFQLITDEYESSYALLIATIR